MNLGTMYYVVVLLGKLSKFSWIMVTFIPVLAGFNVFVMAIYHEQNKTTFNLKPLLKVYITLEVVFIVLGLAIPNKKDVMTIMTANYVDVKVLQLKTYSKTKKH